MVLGSISADMAPIPDGFSGTDKENDLDCPTEGFSSISDAIDDIRQGKVCCNFFEARFWYLKPGSPLKFSKKSSCY